MSGPADLVERPVDDGLPGDAGRPGRGRVRREGPEVLAGVADDAEGIGCKVEVDAEPLAGEDDRSAGEGDEWRWMSMAVLRCRGLAWTTSGSASHAEHMAMRTPRSHRDIRADNEARCRRILAKSEQLRVDDLDWAVVGQHPLDPGVIDTLVYMRDVEGFTGSYVVGLGAHKTTLADPLLSDFLAVWLAEEAGHAAAIDRFLTTYATATGVAVPSQATAPAPHAPRHERGLAHVGGPVGRLVAAAHMTWGAANELLTMNGYRLLADQCDDPMLAELLRRIAAQESRHYSFYLLQAEWRLSSSRLARTVIPRIMDGSWTPVGVGDGYKTTAEFQRVLAVLTRRPEGERIIDRMDRRFAALPGFDRLRIYREAASLAASAA